MDRKNVLIIIGFAILILSVGFLLYNQHLQKEQNLRIIRGLELSNKKDQKGAARDPYKETAVNNSLRKAAKKIQGCYKGYLAKNPPITDGYMEIDWTIRPDGSATKVELISSNIDDRPLHECILSIISKINFPPPPYGFDVYMTYKYNFKKSKDENPGRK